MSLIVQKYGGSSLKTPNDIQRVAIWILMKKNEGNDLVVTVSALGDTTDDLLDLANKISTTVSTEPVKGDPGINDKVNLIQSFQNIGRRNWKNCWL